MPARISRRKIAEYVADHVVANKKIGQILKEVAAFLVETKRTRELELLVRDIESALEVRGIVVADVTSAYQLNDTLKANIAKLVGGKNLVLREVVDANVLGGIRLTTPSQRLDATLRRKIQGLKI